MVEYKHTNKLIQEKPPYLLHHAHNPVDWYPWGPEAFAKAASEDKPIFLSMVIALVTGVIYVINSNSMINFTK